MFPAVELVSYGIGSHVFCFACSAEKLEDYVEMKKDGGFAPIKERKEPNRLAPLVPPGA